MIVFRYLAALLLLVSALPATAQDEAKVSTVAAGLTRASAELQAVDDATVAARDDATRQALRAMGYTLEFEERPSGPINAILFDRKHGTMWGGSSNNGEDYGIAW